MSRQINIVIADDHALLLSGLVGALEDKEINVVARTRNLNEIIPLFEKHKPDILVTDIMFGESRNGLDILKELFASSSEAKVIIFSQYDQNHLIEQAYRMGAMGYLKKVADIEEVVDAIHKVYAGETYFQKDISERLALAHLGKAVVDEKQAIDPTTNIEELFTRKEFEIFKLMAKGFTQTEIFYHFENSDDPGFKISERTIANISTKIKRTLNVKSVAELAVLAYKLGYIQ